MSEGTKQWFLPLIFYKIQLQLQFMPSSFLYTIITIAGLLDCTVEETEKEESFVMQHSMLSTLLCTIFLIKI